MNTCNLISGAFPLLYSNTQSKWAFRALKQVIQPSIIYHPPSISRALIIIPMLAKALDIHISPADLVNMPKG